MTASLDDLYFGWLCSQLGDVNAKPSARTNWSLLRQLHKKEFVWFIPNDDNRFVDGQDFRYEFLEANHIPDDNPMWNRVGCSMLELLMGLSRHLYFYGDGEMSLWFWHLIETIGLKQYNDASFDRNAEAVIDEVLERVIYRQYEANGHGGLFPLTSPTVDQRRVELWYQLNAYLNEL